MLQRVFSEEGIKFIEGGQPVALSALESLFSRSDYNNSPLLSFLEIQHDLEYLQEVNGHTILPWDRLYPQLLDEEAELTRIALEIPPISNLQVSLKHQGSISDANFSIALEWKEQSGARATIQRTGAVVNNGMQAYLLPEPVWRLLRQVQNFSRREVRSQDAQERSWAAIRAQAKRIGADLDGYLENTVILTADRLRPKPEVRASGSDTVVEILPLISGLQESGLSDERWIAQFDRHNTVQHSYETTTEDGRRVHIMVSADARTVLQEIKSYPGRRLVGARAQAFLHNPYALLGEAANRVINEQQFQADLADSDMELYRLSHVLSVNEHDEPKAITLTLSPTYHPEQNALVVELRTLEELRQLLYELRRKAHLPCFVWDGNEVGMPAQPQDLIQDVETLVRHLQNPSVCMHHIFDFTRYTPRVEDIGVFKPVPSIYIARKNPDMNWIPDNVLIGVTIPDNQPTPAPTEDPDGCNEPPAPWGAEPPEMEIDIHALRKAVQEAERIGASMVPCSNGTVIDLKQAQEILKGIDSIDFHRTGAEPPKVDNDFTVKTEPGRKTLTPKKKLVLLIAQNIDAVGFSQLRSQTLEFTPTGKPELPTTFKASTKLLPHQSEGIEHLQHLWLNQAPPAQVRGCVFADDMGLGKTLQLLTFLGWYFENNKDSKPVLILAPPSILENWKNERSRFFTEQYPQMLILYGDALQQRRVPLSSVEHLLQEQGLTKFLRPDWIGDAKIVVTNYETLRDHEFSFSAIQWGIMICDEAQKIKNPAALISKVAKQQQADFKIACTGTPVENSLTDLWNLFDFIQPGYLGSLNEFGRKYCRPIEARTEEQRAAIAELRMLIESQVIRRLKREVVEKNPEMVLKGKIEIKDCKSIILSNHQKSLYNEATEAYRNRRAESQNGEAESRQAGSAMLGLLHNYRMVCADGRLSNFAPSHQQHSFEEYCSRSKKLKWLAETLNAIKRKQEKVIIFSEFKAIQMVLQYYIQQQFGFRPAIINGDVGAQSNGKGQSRQAVIDAFQSRPGFSIIILSPKAVGFGVNIQAANHVIHYTRAWNPAVEDQATDRAYRIGQTKDVFVYYPTMLFDHGDNIPPTFEKNLDVLLSQKRELAEDMLNGASDIDLHELMGRTGYQDASESHIGPEELTAIDGLLFEKLCKRYYESLGYRVIENTMRPQGGVDLIALNGSKGLLIQCKACGQEGQTVGRQGVLDVVADAKLFAKTHPTTSFTLIAITNQHFNDEASMRAEANKVELIERGALLDWLKNNPVRYSELF